MEARRMRYERHLSCSSHESAAFSPRNPSQTWNRAREKDDPPLGNMTNASRRPSHKKQKTNLVEAQQYPIVLMVMSKEGGSSSPSPSTMSPVDKTPTLNGLLEGNDDEQARCHSRPRGRPPKDKIWNYHLGVWEDPVRALMPPPTPPEVAEAGATAAAAAALAPAPALSPASVPVEDAALGEVGTARTAASAAAKDEEPSPAGQEGAEVQEQPAIAAEAASGGAAADGVLQQKVQAALQALQAELASKEAEKQEAAVALEGAHTKGGVHLHCVTIFEGLVQK